MSKRGRPPKTVPSVYEALFAPPRSFHEAMVRPAATIYHRIAAQYLLGEDQKPGNLTRLVKQALEAGKLDKHTSVRGHVKHVQRIIYK